MCVCGQRNALLNSLRISDCPGGGSVPYISILCVYAAACVDGATFYLVFHHLLMLQNHTFNPGLALWSFVFLVHINLFKNLIEHLQCRVVHIVCFILKSCSLLPYIHPYSCNLAEVQTALGLSQNAVRVFGCVSERV